MSDIIQRPSPNFNERAGAKISYLILHYTGMETAEDALNILTDPESEVSAHYTIDEDGTIYQHVEEDKRAWHAGASAWREDENLNSQSIGIEIVNPGHGLGYRPFTPEQIKVVKGLCHDIKTRHPIEHVLAHSDIAPDRKQDPGELFPWKELAQDNIGIWPEVSDEDMVKASGIDVSQALKDFGYHAAKPKNMLLAFQQHYVPEAYKRGKQGVACGLTKGRLYALLAGHLISPK
ncbi:MAG: N-acetylmuramoyl-L-alanine amidase [Alphaproteobacteria bacterium]|nr:N-acetylmuramoyl-L-alanine amidase [Alphaproteobacteria bacterium]